MAYQLVKFTETNEIGTVLSDWLLPGGKVLYPKASDISRGKVFVFLKKKVSPSCDWQELSVSVIPRSETGEKCILVGVRGFLSFSLSRRFSV